MLVDGRLASNVLVGKVKALGGVIYEDDYSIVEHSLVPVVVSRYLIIKLKAHCENLADLTDPPQLNVKCHYERNAVKRSNRKDSILHFSILTYLASAVSVKSDKW